MTRVGVTGGTGFLGWHIRARLLAEGFDSLTTTRASYEPTRLDAFVQQSDVIVHAAGVNRAATTDEIVAGNRSLAEMLAAAIDRSGKVVPIVYANSTQSELDNLYGQAKLDAAEILAAQCESGGAPFLDLVLPHLYGEFGRERYNSAVTTFAHALATGESADVNREGRLELLHAQDVARRVIEFVREPAGGRERMAGRPTSVGEAWDLLERQHERYCRDLTVPAFADAFELHMFNVLRSQLYRTGHYPIPLTLHEDPRGGFAELARADGVGQTSISTSHEGILRGDHFHFDKIERFVVVAGTAEIRLRRVLTDEVRVFPVSGDEPVAIDMPPLTTHNIRNVGDSTLTTVFWAGDHFDPANPDTYAEPVEVPA